ncbi:SDR family oxidoreductase [Sandaracinobacteroides saxicola]|uniref:SDR family oxidoreductase n=1 Tax=Sandaracinobacteroides saxicola TaxID=2759707 RepID=A0A7G5IL41_9SPHN|nr:SDR family oxidoreductase [Sandaracinobacteroides saxicola]QMW24083.1 SDR family oxidoreductase [Sandaracinobacteroides saxicola]
MLSPPEFPFPATALVTGGAKRIGAALARALAADGWHVAIHCHQSRADADSLAAELGGSVVQGDLAHPRIGTDLFAQLAGAPPVRLLVNNASRFDLDHLDDFTAEQWDRHMAVNLRAPALLTQAFAAHLGSGNGAVINLTDAKLAALNPDFLSYTVSKLGLAGFTELAARALAPRIRVNAIAPAVTLVSGPQTRENFAAAHILNPLQRGVTVDHLVAALRFILATPTLTGQTLTLDSGQRFLGLPRDVAYMIDE